MKKIFILGLSLCIMLSSLTVYADSSNAEAAFCILISDIINSEISLIDSSIELKNTVKIESDGQYVNYKENRYTIVADKIEDLVDIYETLIAVKNNTSIKGSGSEYDYQWFYGSSLCISSTIYYNTYYSNDIRYGKISSIYVQCSSNSGTVIDSIKVEYGESGFAEIGGYVQYHNNQYISNYSSVYFPAYWPYIYWDASQGSSTGSTITATVHRSSSGSRQYSFTHNIIG